MKELRAEVPRSSLATWAPGPDREDPVAIIERTNIGRLPDLVPIRHGRMAVSPFAFLRGAAAVMAVDFATLPTTNLIVQLCGDAHLSNFGIFATPERNIVFDLNDFDETLPGPWEMDLRRLVVSVAVVARQLGATDGGAEAVRATVASYRDHLGELAASRVLDVVYARVDIDEVRKVALREAEAQPGVVKRPERVVARDIVRAVEKVVRKAERKDNLAELDKLTTVVDGVRRFRDEPPLLQRLSDEDRVRMGLVLGDGPATFALDYLRTLSEDRRHILNRFRAIDAARKVVGVGSVGTRCHVVLAEGRNEEDPLFLQIKEAVPSVLEAVLGPSTHPHHGQRVVEGQRLIQAASDIFLGWATSPDGHHYYVRQLRDVKGSFDPLTMSGGGLAIYGGACGWVLARAHARSGDPVALRGYVGKGDALCDALVRFAAAYAEQTERDHEAFVAAIDAGRIPAERGV